MNITEDYVSYEVAKLLKEKGFDIPLNYFYNSNGKRGYATSYNWNQTTGDFPDYSCPNLQMAMKWLREMHNYHIEIERNFEYFHNGIMHKPSYDAVVQDIANKDKNYFVAECNTYEEAVEAALKYSLERLI